MDTVAVVGRLLLSLAFVLGLMWLIARRVKRGPRGRGRNDRLIDVLSRQQLSRTASVAVVRVLDQALILGVTDGQVSVLGEADLATAQDSLQESESARPARTIRTVRPASTPVDSERRAPLRGSALSLGTWKQTVDSLRDLTARKT
ncbi:MAG: flagellar biosynthetic protein FliO [Jatrophihabitantaceae bacterium]